MFREIKAPNGEAEVDRFLILFTLFLDGGWYKLGWFGTIYGPHGDHVVLITRFWLERARWWCGMHTLTNVMLYTYICISWHVTVNKGWFKHIVNLKLLLLASSGKRYNELTEGKILKIMKQWYGFTIDRLSHCDSISAIVCDKCFTRAFTAWSPRAMDLPLALAARPNNADSTGQSFWCVERDSQLRRSKTCNVFIFNLGPWGCWKDRSQLTTA